MYMRVFVHRAVVSAVGLSVLRNTLASYLLYRFVTRCVLRIKWWCSTLGKRHQSVTNRFVVLGTDWITGLD